MNNITEYQINRCIGTKIGPNDAHKISMQIIRPGWAIGVVICYKNGRKVSSIKAVCIADYLILEYCPICLKKLIADIPLAEIRRVTN